MVADGECVAESDTATGSTTRAPDNYTTVLPEADETSKKGGFFSSMDVTQRDTQAIIASGFVLILALVLCVVLFRHRNLTRSEKIELSEGSKTSYHSGIMPISQSFLETGVSEFDMTLTGTKMKEGGATEITSYKKRNPLFTNSIKAAKPQKVQFADDNRKSSSDKGKKKTSAAGSVDASTPASSMSNRPQLDAQWAPHCQAERPPDVPTIAMGEYRKTIVRSPLGMSMDTALDWDPQIMPTVNVEPAQSESGSSATYDQVASSVATESVVAASEPQYEEPVEWDSLIEMLPHASRTNVIIRPPVADAYL